jgi:hypothetical protein
MLNRNRLKKSRFAIALAILTMPALIGCGSRNSNNPAPVDNGYYPLPPASQYPLPPVPGGGCAALNAGIGFTGNGVYVSYANIRGGQLPYGGMQTSGQVMVGGPGGSGPYTVQTYEGTNVTMSVEPLNVQTYPQQPYGGYGVQYPQNTPTNIVVPGQANINGRLTLSQLTISDIQYRLGGGMQIMGGYPQTTQYPYPGIQPPVSNLCVTGLGIDVGHYGTRLYGGKFYLYFNGSSQVYELPI